MRTSMLALALAVVAPVVAQAQSPSWQTDYAAAQQKAVAKQRPLAIVFGKGEDGWQQIGGGSLSPETSRILADKYVTCYVDTATPEGQTLARRFELTTPVGLVISDRSANVQAFWHEGPLSADAVIGSLTKYADPERIVTRTESNAATPRTSNYPPTTPFAGVPYGPSSYPPIAGAPSGPSYYPPTTGGVVYPGSNCPTCSGGGCAGGNCSVGGSRRHR